MRNLHQKKSVRSQTFYYLIPIDYSESVGKVRWLKFTDLSIKTF